MAATQVQRIAVVGDDIAGPVVATALAASLQGSDTKITLVRQKDEIPASDVQVFRGGGGGFHDVLGIDETEVQDRAGGVFGLGTRYRGFRQDDRDLLVPLGGHGMTLRLVDFHHYFLKLRAAGGDGADYNDYSLPAAAAAAGHFTPRDAADNPVLRTVAYDICVDRDRYSKYMLERAVELGISIVEGAVGTAELDGDACLDTIVLADGNRIAADFFVDCSDSRSLIDAVEPKQEFLDWSGWLPCDRIATLRTESATRPRLFTSIEAHDDGWIQRMTLQESAVTSFAFSSRLAGDAKVRRALAASAGAADAGGVRIHQQRSGCFARHWIRNCVAIGPAAVTVEPMEVSALQIVQSSVLRLLGMLPRQRISTMLAREYDRVSHDELDNVRDYQALRYVLANRSKGAFWENLAQAELPETLRTRIDLFSGFGRFTRGDHLMLNQANWVSSFLNFGFWPSSYDPMADMIDEQRMKADLERFRNEVRDVSTAEGRLHLA